MIRKINKNVSGNTYTPYTTRHTYSTRVWRNEDFFPDPVRMQHDLARAGRKMVTIVDPHLRADEDFHVFAKAKEQQLLVRTADNTSHFEGDCWPGRSAWVDYLQPAAREYWAACFAPDAYSGREPVHKLFELAGAQHNSPNFYQPPIVTMAVAARSIRSPILAI